MLRTFTIRSLVIVISGMLASTSWAFDETVYRTQVMLNQLGYPAGVEDGLWGKKTGNALKDFAAESDIDFDDKISEELLVELRSQLRASTAVTFTQPPVTKSPVELNANTSRAKRTEYECRLATSSKDKPLPVGFDLFRMSLDRMGLVDLYGDGSIETISGFSDDTWRPDPKNPLYYGNKKRSRDGEDYMVFSPNPNTIIPDGLNFVGGVPIPADLNGDGIDDITVIQQGPD